MDLNKITSISLLSLVILAVFGCAKPEEEIRKPNIIYILADDMGRSDLGVYGQQLIETPNLDRLASEGMTFTNHYSGSTVCAPSRSALLTGFHTGHTPIRGNKEYQPEGQEPLPDSTFTIMELMKKAGYTTGIFGKWGLGFIGTSGDPNNQGTDYFFGYNCQRMAHRYYPDYIWENDQKVIMEGNGWMNKTIYAQDVIQEKTLAFIDQHKDEPFFMYVPLVMPHAELAVPDDTIFQKYHKKFTEETPYKGFKGSAYGEELLIEKYMPQNFPKATYAAMVERADIYVGQIMEKLEKLGLTENTILMFSSDNGPHVEGGHDPDFFDSNGPLRGYKRDLYEGGIRAPFIVKWPDKVKPTTTTNHIPAFWDLMPTLADIVGYDSLPKLDGISFLPTLTDDIDQKAHDYLYWEFVKRGGKQAVRKGDWKAVKLNVFENPEGPVELYNLAKDQGETNNVAEQYPDIAKEMDQLMKEAHTLNVTYPLFESERLKTEENQRN